MMACRILRAPAVTQSISRNFPILSQRISYPLCMKMKHATVLSNSQSRGYNNYKTHGEMAALADPADGSVFTDEPEYPEIFDMTSEGQLRRKRQAHYDEVEKMPTAHHKMFLVNVERGREEMFYVGDLHYNSLEMYQYATRTSHKMEEPLSDTTSEAVDPVLISIIEEVLVTNGLTTGISEQSRSCNVIRSILDAIRYHYKLADVSVLEEPRIEAFWHHPSFKTNLDKERFEDRESFAPWLQFAQQAQLMLSSEIPLAPIIEPESEQIFGSDFPTYDFFPEELGMCRKKHRLVSTAGYWCNTFQYPMLTTSALDKVMPTSLDPSVTTDHLNRSERRRRLAAHGLMMNFAAAVGAASSCGFTVFHEITYPFVAQHMVTDGQTWHFSKFQLNTISFGPDFPQDKQNFAWSSEEEKLYESVKNGKVQGLNTSVLSRIVEMIRAPRGVVENPRPYTDLNVEKEFLARGEKMFKEQATRKFHLADSLQFEVPDWVKIYKMRDDAPPTPMIKWERPRPKAPHIFQFNKEMYNEEIQEIKDRHKKVARDKFYGIYPLRRFPIPLDQLKMK